MRLATFLFAAAALVAVALPTSGATTDALDPLASAVAARRDATGDVTRADRVRRRRLDAVAAKIAAPSASLADDMRVARGVGASLRRWFRRDAEFSSLFDQAVGALTTSADDERRSLAAWSGRLADDLREATLLARLRDSVGVFRRARRAGGVGARLGYLSGGCARIADARAELDLVGAPGPLGPAMPDFALVDVAAGSPTRRRAVSPRDFLGMASAWYFGHAT